MTNGRNKTEDRKSGDEGKPGSVAVIFRVCESGGWVFGLVVVTGDSSFEAETVESTIDNVLTKDGYIKPDEGELSGNIVVVLEHRCSKQRRKISLDAQAVGRDLEVAKPATKMQRNVWDPKEP